MQRIELRASKEEKRLLVTAAGHERFGALSLLDDPLKLILPLTVIADAMGTAGDH